jgi:hypothetical protein
VATTVLPTNVGGTANAQLNNSMNQFTLQATGGVLPYSWAVTTGSLPTGIVLDSATALVHGTPTGTTQTFIVTVTDSTGGTPLTATQSLTLTVATPVSAAVTLDQPSISQDRTTQAHDTMTYSDGSTADVTNQVVGGGGGAITVQPGTFASDFTGSPFTQLTTDRVRSHPNVKVISHATAVDLLTVSHHSLEPTDVYRLLTCVGAYVLDQTTGKIFSLLAKETILATGGLGSVFLHTTRVYPSKEKIERKDQLAWKIAEIASDSAPKKTVRVLAPHNWLPITE